MKTLTDIQIDNKIKSLIANMTIEEKISQMVHASQAIDRLNIPAYNWWNECLHGVARAGTATVFPQAIGMAATFNRALIHEVATAISDEARAKYNSFKEQNDHGGYKGLTFWSPNINIFRDPRWGRGHETYGEDPFLTGEMGLEFVKGLQGDNPDFLKTIATPKHLAVHSGPEVIRHSFNVDVNHKDLWETYLPAFEKCVVDAQAYSVMGAYNRLYGVPACASSFLLEDILRTKWGFEGYVVSDCGAICDFHQFHKVTNSPEESAALAVNNGCDLNCGNTYNGLLKAYHEGMVKEEVLDKSVIRLLRARYKLGMFEEQGVPEYDGIPYSVVSSKKHHELAIETARQSIVLLKNRNNTLPLSGDLRSIAVIGPNADSRKALIGNYYGTPDRWITPLQGIINAVGEDTRVNYAEGCHLFEIPETKSKEEVISEALIVAKESDVVLLFLGLDAEIEGEAGDAYNSDAGGDKVNLQLPGLQQELLEAVAKVGKPVILNLISGSALAVKWAHENVDAILQCWYPGPEAGKAIADIIFGEYSPSGRLPVTFVNSVNDLPPFDDYSMKNRTYKYIESKPLYPFGYGLSYSNFIYSNLSFTKTGFTKEDLIEFSVDITSDYSKVAREVVQVYFKNNDSQYIVPSFQLIDFKSLLIEHGKFKRVQFRIPVSRLSSFNSKGEKVLEPGNYTIYVGGSQPDERSLELTGVKPKRVEITL